MIMLRIVFFLWLFAVIYYIINVSHAKPLAIHDIFYDDDDFEEIVTEYVFVVGDSCPDDECRSKRMLGRFCEICGTCQIIGLMRMMLHKLPPKVSEDDEEIPMTFYDPNDHVYLDPHSECIRRAVKACPTACPIDQLRADDDYEKFVPVYNHTDGFTIHIPKAYRCRRDRNINKICLDMRNWFKDIIDIDFKDGIKTRMPPPNTTICLYEDIPIIPGALET